MKNFHDCVIIAYEQEEQKSLKELLTYKKESNKIAIVIGPEGGFSEGDIGQLTALDNVSLVSLGKRILRTETAGVATVAMLLYEYEL